MTECVFVCVRQREKYFCTADSKQMDAAYSASSFLYVVILLSPSQKYKAPFRCENFWLLATVALSFVFDKNYSIMDYLGLKDSSRQLRANCAISYSFYLHLMLHACAARFDVTGNHEIFWILNGI